MYLAYSVPFNLTRELRDKAAVLAANEKDHRLCDALVQIVAIRALSAVSDKLGEAEVV